ncbi:hypothetical protein X975_01081, partial [Stegodyphus mimosarum]
MIHYPNYFVSAPCVYTWIKEYLSSGRCQPFPYIPQVTNRLCHIIMVYAILASVDQP